MNLYLRMLRGYVRICISGYGVNRFINICSKRGIHLWEVEKKEDSICLNICVADFRKIRDIVRKTNVKVVIMSKHGLPFFFARLSYRKGFVLGAFLCAAWLIYTSNFLWAIEIEGNYSLTDEVILDYLEDNNIKIGAKLNEIDAVGLEKGFRKDFEQITWISIGQEGTTLTIDIKERDVKEYDEHKEGISSLYAPYDGEVVSIVVRSGIAKIKAGDVVEKGQLLVDGIIPVTKTDGSITGYQFVAADADIIIRYKTEYYDEISCIYNEKVYTTQSFREYYLRFGNRIYTFHFFTPEYELSDCHQSFYQIKLWEYFYLPVWIGKGECQEYILQRSEADKNMLKQQLYENLEIFLANLEEKGVQNIQKDVKISTSGSMHILSGELIFTTSDMQRGEIDTSLGMEFMNGEYSTIDDGNER